MTDLPDISVELEAKISKFLLNMAIVKRAIRDVYSTAQREALTASAKSLQGSTFKKLSDQAVKDMLKQVEKDSAAAGQASGRNWINAFKKELKGEKVGKNVPNWLPWIGAAMPVAPAAMTGAVGILGALGVAGLGAAAGLGAFALAAKEVLSPVQTAFTALDNVSKSIPANATALQIWLAAGSTTRTTATGKVRVSTNTLGPGLGFLANPHINYGMLTPAQQKALVLQYQSMTGLPTSEKAQITALMAQRRAYLPLSGPQRGALSQTQLFDSRLVSAQQAAAPAILGLYGAALSALGPALKYITPLANIAAGALMPLVKEIGSGIKSQGFAQFMLIVERMAKLGISSFGQSIINFAIGIGHIFAALANSGVVRVVTTDLLKMSAAFRKDTLPSNKGFMTFIADMKQNAPTVAAILRNLVAILGNLFKALGGGIGAAELKGLNDVLGFINMLSRIPSIGPLIYNLIALSLIFSKLGTLRLITASLEFLGKGLATMALLKLGPLIGGMLGLDVAGLKLGEMWKTIGKAMLTFSVNLIKSFAQMVASGAVWVAKSIAQGAVWVAGMIARAAVVVATNVAAALATAAAWVAANAAMIIASGGIILLLAAIVIGVYELYKHWGAVWGFIKKIAKEAWDFIWNGFGKFLLPLLGPVGLLALGIIEVWKNWKTIWGFITSLVHAAWDGKFGVRTITLEALKNILDVFFAWGKGFLRIAADAFGWVPGVGPKLRAAQKDLSAFETSTNRTLDGLIKNRTANVNFKFGNVPPNLAIPSSYAGGTGGARAGWAWVGERGPELVNMRGGETVIPSHVSMGYADGTTGWPPVTGYIPSGPQWHGLMTGISAGISLVDRRLAVALNKEHARAMAAAGPGGGAPAANAALARRLYPMYASGPVWDAWNYVEMREAGWNQFATNPSSGAYGIPQALPPTKMPFAAQRAGGSNPTAQIRWMWNYMAGRYGGPIGAAAHERAFNWYGDGGFMPPGSYGIVGERGAELVQAGRHGATITPGPITPGPIVHHQEGKLVHVTVYTNEIRPQYHAAMLGWELARRSAF